MLGRTVSIVWFWVFVCVVLKVYFWCFFGLGLRSGGRLVVCSL